MERFWIPLLAILTSSSLLHQTASAGDTTEVIGAVGGSVTFRSHNTATDGDAAFWTFGSTPILSVPLKGPSQPLFLQDKFKKRFTVSERGRALRISQLSMEDAGTYSLAIGEKTSTFTLQVYRELPEPRVTCEAQNCSNRSCSLALRCSVPGDGFGNVSYTWGARSQPSDEGSGVLLVHKSSLDEPEPVTCTARNAVSSRNVTVTTPGGLCTENSTHPPGLPGALSGKLFGIGLAAAITGVTVLLLGSLVLFKSRGRLKVRLPKPNPTDTAATAEYMTVYAEVGHTQQPIPNGIKAKPTEGESSTTIYSLVKRPEKVGDGAEGNDYAAGLELV